MQLIDRLDRRYKLILTLAAFLIVLFLASRVAFWLLVFIAAASVAELYNLYVRTPIRLDLTKLGTVLASVAYGAGPGILVGLTATFFSKLFSARLDATIFISLAGIVAVAVAAAAFPTASIHMLGTALVLLYYAITTPLNLLLGEEPGYAAAYVLSSIAVNIILFTQAAPRILPLL